MGEEHIKSLAVSVAALGDNAQFEAGKMLVLEMALLSLVRSHPNQAAFATEFRRCWQLAGSQHSNDGLGVQAQDGIDAMLGLLEEACPDLAVRPSQSKG